MNRWIRNALLSSSLVGALALVPGAVAFASDAAHAGGDAHGHHGHHGKGGGLLGAALKLDSLTVDQRAAIEKLEQQRHAAGVPVRAADAQFLTALAQQVERAAIEPQGLAASLATEQSAANVRAGVDSGTLNQLHAILTPAQRGQLVDGLVQTHGEHAGKDGGRGTEHDGDHGARHEGGSGRWLGRALDLTPAQREQIRANLQAQGSGTAQTGRGEYAQMLQAFRGDSFDATAFVRAHDRGERIEKLAAAAVPVLTPAQRATLADQLRRRAAHESA